MLSPFQSTLDEGKGKMGIFIKRKSSSIPVSSDQEQSFANGGSPPSSLAQQELAIQRIYDTINKTSTTKENMKAIEQNKELLNNFVDGLDKKLDGCIDHHNEVLLRMFRFHVSSIKKEFRDLLEENYKLKNRPIDMSEIEKSVHFLKDECYSLSKRQEKSRQIIAELKSALKERETEIEFLKKQVKVSSKQAHLLKVALECKTASLEKMEETDALREKERMIIDRALELIGIKGNNLNQSGSFCFQLNHFLTKKKRKLIERDPSEKVWEEIFEETCDLGIRNQAAHASQTASYEREIIQLKREVASSKNKFFSFITSLNKIQQIFLNCLDAAKSSDKGGSPDVSLYLPHKDETFISSIDLESNNTTAVTLGQQRAEAFKRFIENEEVRKAFLELFTKKQKTTTPRTPINLELLSGFKTTIVKRKMSLPGSRSGARSRTESRAKKRPETCTLSSQKQEGIPVRNPSAKKNGNRLHFAKFHSLLQRFEANSDFSFNLF